MMSNLAHVVSLVVLIALWIGIAYLSGRVARSKGRDFGVYFVAALILGVIVLIVALILPRHHQLGCSGDPASSS
jgi:uncharacterized membrane protein